MNPLALLAALRAHAAGAPSAGGPVGGPSAGPGPFGPGASAPQGGGNFSQLVKQMISLGVQAQQAAPDAVDASGMAKIVATLHQFEASAQQDNDAAMGVSPAVRAMRRNTAAAQQG